MPQSQVDVYQKADGNFVSIRDLIQHYNDERDYLSSMLSTYDNDAVKTGILKGMILQLEANVKNLKDIDV